MRSAEPTTRELDWQALMDKALTLPGSVGNVYSRFHNYSFLNCLYLAMQGAEGPVASYARWQSLGRQVVKGARGYEIVRPITVKREDQRTGEERSFLRFKTVRGAFSYTQTTGEPLPPPPEPADWSLERAEKALEIRRVPFAILEGNSQGYSLEREYAINPMAVFPMKTTLHEIGHIVIGHTTQAALGDYQAHRGVKEFQAESTAYLAGHELGVIDEAAETVTRGYVQHWLGDERPPDVAVRQVFSATDKIIKAGRLVIEGVEE